MFYDFRSEHLYNHYASYVMTVWHVYNIEKLLIVPILCLFCCDITSHSFQSNQLLPQVLQVVSMLLGMHTPHFTLWALLDAFCYKVNCGARHF